jgi:hypothetical protein
VNPTGQRQASPPDGVGPDLAWLIPTQRSRGDADKEPAMPPRRSTPYLPADEPDRWTPLDYVAACSRVLDVLIDWYLGPSRGRRVLWHAVTKAFRGNSPR